MRRLILAGLLAGLTTGCAPDAPAPPVAEAQPDTLPPEPPAAWRSLIGEYALDGDTLSVLEDGGHLYLLPWHETRQELRALDDASFETVGDRERVTFRHAADRRVTGLDLDGSVAGRLTLGGQNGGTFKITPLRPVSELREEALAATPPEEEGDFLPSDLVELTTLDPTIRLDIRYATDDNFMGTVFYSSARAFLQRPAAEALVRAHEYLKARGYGLLIHDGYRPWYVTKMFWDATPEPLRVFVANPASGSRHNRGCAVDLTLYDLASGEPVTMTGGYDEMSPRSYPDYAGGTTRQRWLRALLRQAMEAQGFTVYEAEWWHFDYKDWKRYRIGNQRFEEIGG